MELGILMVPAGEAEEVIKLYKRWIEDLGPDCIWLPDRLLAQDLTDLNKYAGLDSESIPLRLLDPFIFAAAMAMSDLRPQQFGIAVTDFIRRGPADLARATDTLSQLIRVPFNIGFGAGELINLSPLGYDRGPKPVAYMEECLERFKSINETGIDVAAGQKALLGYNLSPGKVWIGGQRDRMLALTARYADGWLPAWRMSPAEYREKAAIIKKLAGELGRPCPKMGMFAGLMLGESKKEILAYYETASPLEKVNALDLAGEIWSKWGLEHPAGKASKGLYDVILKSIQPSILHDALRDVPAAFCGDIAIVGNREQVLDELWQFKTAGLEHLVLFNPSHLVQAEEMDSFYADFKCICAEIRRW